jgi:glycosyltransferase involved in cell wall biosynthesis
MASYAARWNDKVVAFLDPAARISDSLDSVELDPRELPFDIELAPYGSKALWHRMRGAGVVMGVPDHRLCGLSRRLQKMKIPSVYSLEHTLKTRLLHAAVESHSALQAARRAAWELEHERRVRKDLRLAQGMQCNGIPAFEAYRGLGRNPFLYFDTRTPADSFASMTDIERRSTPLRTGRPLRLAFAGRLIRSRGVDHLVQIARRLDNHGVPFELTICGAGELGPRLSRDIVRLGLERMVHMVGVLDFETQLLPFLREHVDLFVMPHRQGDPSTAYLEALSCGVPIVGYGNESLSGLLERAVVGWSVPVDRPHELAKTIALLNRQRESIVERAKASVRFAQEHSFEKTFDRRVQHLERVALAAA